MTIASPSASEKTLLVGLEHSSITRWDVEDSLSELRQLAATAGANVVDTVIQRLDRPTAPYYIGKGKAEEIAKQCDEHQITSLIFDDELSPAQGRNLELLTSRKVLDRTQLILDIFAQRARTKEGRLQIELAQLQYLLPRLTRMWTHLSRQSGGIGTRGPGETQLEVDRRRVQERIARLERDLKEVRKNRGVQREGRLRRNWPVASLVGYTNAGKSSLLNRLTGAGVLAMDKLFATLDPTTRQVTLPNRQKILLTDTVGFIRKLPHPSSNRSKPRWKKSSSPTSSFTSWTSAIPNTTNRWRRWMPRSPNSVPRANRRLSSSTKSTSCRTRKSSSTSSPAIRAASGSPPAPAKASRL